MDDLTIDRPTVAITLTHFQGSDTINSLTSNEALVVALDPLFGTSSLSVGNGAQINGTLTISGDLSGSGSLTVGSGSTLTVSGNLTMPACGALNVDGTALISGSGTSNLLGTLNVGLGASGASLQKIGTGTLVFSGPQNWGAGSALLIGSSGSFPEEQFSLGIAATVPEPDALWLLIVGGLCLATFQRWLLLRK